MSCPARPKTRALTALAQDPTFGPRGRVVTTRLILPEEDLASGPKGHRIHVIDYDASTGRLFRPLSARDYERGDPYEGIDERDRLVGDPRFHAQNVYAITMATLCRFESALGRHVSWGFDSKAHRLKIAPHAFAEANAFYSRRDESLLFGYFPGMRKEPVFTCLSHDIVVHECTHAILDGLRPRFIRASSSDQAAFHEGFADVVALLSVLRNQPVVEELLRKGGRRSSRRVRSTDVQRERLKRTALFALGEQMGRNLESLHRDALRRSVDLSERPDREQILEKDTEFKLPHRRGEVLVAATMEALLTVWTRRLEGIGAGRGQSLNLGRVAEEGATAAAHLMKIAIRALDATPPVDLNFPDYLSALLTTDYELFPNDSKYEYRRTLRDSFGNFGIKPATRRRSPEEGLWSPPQQNVSFSQVHFEPMQWDREEMAHFLWENRVPLELEERAFTRVQSVRPIVRTGMDGFVLRETVVEYFQRMNVKAKELADLKIRKPSGMSDEQLVRLQGGGTLIFDEYGRLKFHIGSGVTSRRQSKKLKKLFQMGAFRKDASAGRHFQLLHQERRLPPKPVAKESW